MGSWWRRRSLRARLTFIATAGLAAGLAVGSLLLVRGFANSRLAAVDRSSRALVDNVTALAAAGALPGVLPVQSGQSAQVLDVRGAIRAVSSGTLRTLPLVPLGKAEMLAGEPAHNVVVDAIDGQGLSRVVVQRVGSGASQGYVIVAVSLRDEQDTIRGVTRAVVILVPVLLVTVAAILWLLLGRALGAVSELQRTARGITDPGAGIRLPLPDSTDEVHALTATLNEMLDRLAAANERERSFVADAAHELRSPLASMRAQLEVACAHPGTTSTVELASDSLRDVERLASLVDALLVLARLDAGAPFTHRQVDLAAIAGIGEQGPCVVNGDPQSLGRAIDNLVANARRHARSQVRISARHVGGRAEIRVEDDGNGIPSLDRARVFERFVRLDDARSRRDGGSGLGLAIVRATARSHGGDVSIEDSALGGACFILRLPLSASEAGRSR